MAEYTTLEQVKIRLKQFHIDSESSEVVFDHLEENPLLEQLISQAEADIRAKRIYPKSYTEEKIAADMKKFQSVVVNLVVYDRSQAGENFMASYSEMVCREHGETVRICLLVYFHLQKFYNPIEIEGFRRLCVTMLLIPVIRLQAAHFKGGGRCANKLGRRYMM